MPRERLAPPSPSALAAASVLCACLLGGLLGAAGCAARPPATRNVDGRPVRPARVDQGLAAWYRPTTPKGRELASGERYNADGYTAAHRTLPFGTRVIVENLRNQRRIIVRINDRGPYGRAIIDLSYAAARELRMLDDGVVPVRLIVLGEGGGG